MPRFDSKRGNFYITTYIEASAVILAWDSLSFNMEGNMEIDTFYLLISRQT